MFYVMFHIPVMVYVLESFLNNINLIIMQRVLLRTYDNFDMIII